MKTRSASLWAAVALLCCVTGAWAQSGDAPPAQSKGIAPALMAKAQAGNAAAEFYVGFAYQSGKGVPQDYAQAAVWYRKSAEQGNADAQAALGTLYRKGQGVPQDYAEAAIWWRKAADQGDMFAQVNLGTAYERGRGVFQDYAQAAVWYRKAAEQGEPEAQANLGLLYVEGKGVPQSYADAYFWLELAVAEETQEEQATDLESRDDAAKKLTPEDLMKVQERASKWFAAHPPEIAAPDDTSNSRIHKDTENPTASSSTQNAAPQDWVKGETDQIRAMVQAIKQCPANVTSSAASTMVDGPPYNATWDFKPSDSVRAPYSGFIEFAVRSTIQCSAARRQSSPVGCDIVERPQFPLVLRYEYDLSPDGLSLSKILVRRDNETEWSNRPNVSNYCWERAAQPTGIAK